MSEILDVVSVAYRSGEDLARLIEDLPSMTGLPHRLHVFDNTGNPKTLTIAWNDLAREGRAEYIAFLNTDIRLSPGWAERLVDGLERIADAGAALPAPVGHDWPRALDPGSAPFHDPATCPAPTREAMEALSKSAATVRSHATFGPGDRASFFAVLLRRRHFEALKGFDERLRFYAQDHDLQRRLQGRLGLHTVRIDGCPVWHRCGGSRMASIRSGDGVDFGAEMAHYGRVLADLESGRAVDWELLPDEERARIRMDPKFCVMPKIGR